MGLELAGRSARLSTRECTVHFTGLPGPRAAYALSSLPVPGYRKMVHVRAVDALYEEEREKTAVDRLRAARMAKTNQVNVRQYAPNGIDDPNYLVIDNVQVLPERMGAGRMKLHSAILYFSERGNAPREVVIVTPSAERITYCTDSAARPLLNPLLDRIASHAAVKEWDFSLKHFDSRRAVRELQWGWGSVEDHPEQFIARLGLEDGTRKVLPSP